MSFITNPRMNIRIFARSIMLMGLVSLASGCAGDMDDLRTYIDEVKQRPGGRIEPLPQIKPYEVFTYAASSMRSPFVADRPQVNARATGPRPDANRNKEFLEQFPLDTLDMVGTVNLSGRTFGLVQAKDGLVHRVSAGQYVGQNEGRIISISESEIVVEELVPDGIGGFIKRPAALGVD